MSTTLYRIAGPVGADPTERIDGTARFPLGTEMTCVDATNNSFKKFVYARANALVEPRTLYTIDKTYTVGAKTTSTTAAAALPTAGCVVDTELASPVAGTYTHGFVQTAGYFTGLSALSALAANALVYTSATVGSVDDAGSNNYLIQGLNMVGTAGDAGSKPFFSGSNIRIENKKELGYVPL